MIYLDNAATTRIDDEVLETMMPYLKEDYGNPGGHYSIGYKARDAVDHAREQVAKLINAKPEQIIFTSGGTEANNMVFNVDIPTNHIISGIEHDSIYNKWISLLGNKEQEYYYMHLINPNESGLIEIDSVRDELGCLEYGRVYIMHTNNETGVVNPIKDIADICNEGLFFFHTDCVQALGTTPLDMTDLGCDTASFSSHKIHGPKGIGALYVKNPKNIIPLIHGGEDQEFGKRGGTENVPGIVGFGKACEILCRDKPYDMCYNLIATLYDELQDRLKNRVHINGIEGQKSKILNVRIDGVNAESLLLYLASQGIYASAGSACRSHNSLPSRTLKAMGLRDEEARSSVRFSVSKYNTFEEMAKTAKTVANYVENVSKLV